MHKQMYELPEPWEEAVIGWMEWLITRGSPATTLRLRRGHVRGMARKLGTRTPAEVTTDDITRVAARQSWSKEHRRGLRTSLIQFYDWAERAGIVETNPAIELPHVPGSTPHPRSVSDRMYLHALSQADERERMATRLADEVGMRRGEVARCHTDDVVESYSGYQLVVHGKGDKQRIVPISDRLARDILRGPGAYTPGYGRTGYLFPGRVDGHLSADYIGKLVGDLLPVGWSMHKLRHRFATRMYAACGNNVVIVSRLLGHASIATTQRYLAITDDELRAAVNALEATAA